MDIVKFARDVVARPDWYAMVFMGPEDLLEDAARMRGATEEAERLAGLQDDERLSDALFDIACDALRLDPLEVDIPGVDDGVSFEEIEWTAGLYRRFLAPLAGPNGAEKLLLRLRVFAGWRARLLEARAMTLSEDPPPPPADATPGSPVLTMRQAAAELGVHPKTCLRYLQSGELRGAIVGKGWRVRREEVARFMRGGSRHA